MPRGAREEEVERRARAHTADLRVGLRDGVFVFGPVACPTGCSSTQSAHTQAGLSQVER